MASIKLVVVFLVCIVVCSALNVNAEIMVSNAAEQKFSSCMNECIKECVDSKQGYTVCEMKCDSDCSEKELMDKLKSKFH